MSRQAEKVAADIDAIAALLNVDRNIVIQMFVFKQYAKLRELLERVAATPPAS